MIHLDTTFLVDLLREQRRGRLGPASAYLETLADDEVLSVSVHAVCELMAGAFAAGARADESNHLGRLMEALVVHYPDERFAPRYGRLLASLRAAGRSIDAMDLLIATAAIIDGAPLVTRHARHFAEIPGLATVGY